ncbi:zinc finger protein [Anopheles sinensis]|uniref:Zinc finger protein n=1 Tax=Anopheles sinensis TaxID=74873 RepID=A0A084WHA3_ANOSI|nr:zinc finger protein [Anopheles sinensis]
MENDGLPSLCCVQCRSDLIYSVAIRRKCLEAENTLKAVLQITALKLDIQEISVEEDRKPDLPILMECDVANKTRVLNHKCCGCSSSFETENELMEHSRLIHATNPPLPDPTRPFQCNVCYRWIKTQRGIEVHKNVMRNRQFNGESSGRFEIPFVAYDEKSIPNGDSTTFVRELASVDGIKQEDPVEVDDLKIFECSVCEACFLDASSFQKHIEMCQQEANIDCIAIGSNMELTDGTDDHENDPTISSIERGYENDAVESNNSTQQNHKCCGCLTNFDSQDALMEHSQAVHAPDAPKPNEMKPFQYSSCCSDSSNPFVYA